MPRLRPHNLLIIGFGYAGRRFAKATRYLETREPGTVRLAGACDVAPAARELAGQATRAFASLEEAMEEVSPSVVVVTVNEEAHADVLRRLAPFAPRVILCEKPLTATLDDAESLPPAIKESPLTVNFVERQSDVLEPWFSWAPTRSGLTPLRVEFFWGKHRIADPRPTMGVLSEMAHPLDLVDHVFGFEQFEVVHAYGLESDYSPHHHVALDTLSFVGRTEAYAVVGVSSFAWPRRHRGISALLIDDEGLLSRLTVDFDAPRWDCDRLRIERVDPATGRCEKLVEHAVDDADTPETLRGVAKVASFISDSLVRAEGRQPVHEVVDFDQALKIQRVLGLLDAELHQERVSRVSVVGKLAEHGGSNGGPYGVAPPGARVVAENRR